MPKELKVDEDLVVPGSELTFAASRSGGPGGQHVNKTSTRVTLQWDVAGSSVLNQSRKAFLLDRLASRTSKEGVLTVHADDERSQARNRERARERMAALIRQGLAKRKRRVPTRLRAGAKARRVDEKRRRGAIKRLRRSPKLEE